MPGDQPPPAPGAPGAGSARQERLGAFLRSLRAAGQELDPQEMLDVLWLAARLPDGDTGLPLARARAVPRGHAPEADSEDPPDSDEADGETRESTPPPGSGRAAPELHAAPPPPPPTPGPLPRPDPPDGPRDPGSDSSPVPPPREKSVLPLRVPEDKALRGELLLGRALRPLKRKRPSRWREEFDESGTAAALAETGLPDVVMRPVRERWLHLVLVVDDGLSMLLWHRLAAELRAVLQRLGAFSSLRVHGLDTRGTGRPRLRGHPFAEGSTTMSPSVITDPCGRTLVLVVSDGMGTAWRNGRMHDTLLEWADAGPAALVHTLPSALWEASGIQADPWRATTRRAGGANTSWEIADPVLPPELAPFDGVPVPVLEPTPHSLTRWSALLTSAGTTVELPLLTRPRRHAPIAAPRAAHSLQHFRDAATPEAYRLAAHLAAVSPVSVPVMRLVQEAVPWRTRTAHLAEVFLGGLLHPRPAPVPGPQPAHQRIFDFTEGTKSALLDAVPSGELLRTGRRIGRRLEQLAGRSPDFPAWLAHPDGKDRLPDTFRAFTVVERRLMARFGVAPDRHLPVPAPDVDAAPAREGWTRLTPADPEHLGPYRLLGRRTGLRTLVYRARDHNGTEVAVRTVRPELPLSLTQLLDTEAKALRRMSGRYAPRLVDADLHGGPPWLAMSPVPHALRPDWPPTRLSEALAASQLDILSSLLLAWHIAGALSICHLNGLVPADLTTDGVLLNGRSITLSCLSDCAIDGEYAGQGPVPTEPDSIFALGKVLQQVSGKHQYGSSGFFDTLGLWQGETWEPLRELVGRCLSGDPDVRPSANEAAGVLSRYIALATTLMGKGEAPPDGGTPGADALERPALLEVPVAEGRSLRVASRAPNRELAETIRQPLATHSRHLMILGAHVHCGRTTTAHALGAMLANVRGEAVLAMDAAPARGDLYARLVHRTPASVPELLRLPPDAPLEDIRACLSRTVSGMDVLSRSPAHRTPSPGHADEYARVLRLVGRHYPVIIGDWAARLDDWLTVPLERTDGLVVSCRAREQSLTDLEHALEAVRRLGFERLADHAAVVVATGDLRQRAVTDRLRGHQGPVVLVPFDPHLSTTTAVDPHRLRKRTAQAFLKLAAGLLPRGTD